MKFFLAIALIATVASAAFVKPSVVSGEAAEIQEIIAAIQSPNTDPATAAALEQMLLEAMGVKPEPISVGPAIVDNEPISVGPSIIGPSPIAVGPEIVDLPVVDGGAVIAPTPVVVAPAPVEDAAAATPLVQIILNINQAAAESSPAAPAPVAPAPVIVDEIAPEPVQVVEVAPEPVQVVEVAPVQPEPVQVVETAPVAVEPVIIGTPILPSPAVVLPEELN